MQLDPPPWPLYLGRAREAVLWGLFEYYCGASPAPPAASSALVSADGSQHLSAGERGVAAALGLRAVAPSLTAAKFAAFTADFSLEDRSATSARIETLFTKVSGSPKVTLS
jgi:hypothetical protein